MRNLILAGALVYFSVWAKNLVLLIAAERAYLAQRNAWIEHSSVGIHDDTISDSEGHW